MTLDDFFKGALPTRDGGSSGKANEREMLTAVGGPNAIRTKIQETADGTVMLRTRGGFPEFTLIKTTEKVVVALRGFLARVSASTFGVLFTPSDLHPRNTKFTPVGFKYFVSSFRSTHNEGASASTNWHDVWTFVQGKLLLVNNKVVPSLPVVGEKGFFPYIISPVDYYDASSRAFSVGREHVKAHVGSSTVTQALEPISPRNEYRAMVGGVSVDADNHSATMRQFWFTGATWDSIAGGWAMSKTKVSMLLTAPYLQKSTEVSSVGRPSAVPALVSSTSGNEATSSEMPLAEIAVLGVGELGTHNTGTTQHVVFPWREVFYGAPQNGYTDVNYSQSVYSGSVSTSGGGFLTSSTSTITFRSNSEGKGFPAGYIPMGSTPWVTPGVVQLMHNTDTGFYWQQTPEPHPTGGIEGQPTRYTSGQVVSGTRASYATKQQEITFSVDMAGVPLLSGSVAHYVENGNQVSLTAKSGRYASLLADPYGWVYNNVGLGVGMHFYTSTSTPPDLVDAADALLVSKASEWSGCKRWATKEGSDEGFYDKTITARPNVDNRSVQWTTRDYILFDEREECYIYVEADYSGSQAYTGAGTGTLTVKIKVDSRFGNASTTVFSDSFVFSDILPETDLGSGVLYIPTPRLSAIFTPKYCEQGDFVGAAYTTRTEEINGATPALLVNCVLRLDTYAAVGDAESESHTIGFVPCNLLEMLYSYVFSTEYGLSNSERYPVTYPLHYNALMNNLFGVQFRVAIRDGVFVDWLDTFGGMYASEQTQEISRI